MTIGADGHDDVPRHQMLARATWPGLEMLLCREDIRRPTHWSIGESRHTLIVHLGGSMRELDTEIEGAGACHGAPAPGDIWLVPAGHRYASQAIGHLITYAELRIQPDADVPMSGLTAGRLAALAPRLAHRDEFLYQSVVQMTRWIGAGDDLAAMMAEEAQWLLRRHLHRDYREAGPDRRPSRRESGLSPALARRLDQYIDARLGEPVRLRDLATIAGMTTHRLLPAFRQSFGTTPARYILDRRLGRARWLLLNSGREIAEIALATGFASHSHFSAAFGRAAGITPSQFRAGQRTLVLPTSPDAAVTGPATALDADASRRSG